MPGVSLSAPGAAPVAAGSVVVEGPLGPELVLAPSPPTPLACPPLGLTNPSGQTCFLNAPLQLLLACPPLMQQLQHPRSRALHDALHGAPGLHGAPSLHGAPGLGKGPLTFALQQAALHASGACNRGQQGQVCT